MFALHRRRFAVAATIGALTLAVSTGSAFGTTTTPHGKSAQAPGHVKTAAPVTSGGVSAGTISSAGSTVTPPGCPNTFHDVNTGNGANTTGPYNSTCNGSPSANGNGSGSATGKPCAGCVGNADFRNPPGQLPNGNDHNKGYECDKNNGAGKGNPAHSACAIRPVSVTSITAPKPTSTSPPAVLGTQVDAASATNPSVTTAPIVPATVQSDARLAHTGMNVMMPAAVGLLSLLLGLGMSIAVFVRKHGLSAITSPVRKLVPTKGA